MKNLSIVALAFTVLLLNACSGGHNAQKRVIIMASGKLTVADKIITLNPSLTHNEQELTFPDEKLTLTLNNTAGGSKTFDLTEPGVYLLNLQTDTLIGGLVNYGSLGMPGSITAEEMDHIIESTQQLMQGTNASDAKSTFFILPMTIKKISAKENTKVVGSFKGIPYKNEAGEDGKLPDVIKFFSVKQKRETLKDLMEQRAKIKINH